MIDSGRAEPAGIDDHDKAAAFYKRAVQQDPNSFYPTNSLKSIIGDPMCIAYYHSRLFERPHADFWYMVRAAPWAIGQSKADELLRYAIRHTAVEPILDATAKDDYFN